MDVKAEGGQVEVKAEGGQVEVKAEGGQVDVKAECRYLNKACPNLSHESSLF